MVRRIAAFSLVCAALIACSSFSGGDDDVPGGGSASDAGDGAPIADGGTGVEDVSVVDVNIADAGDDSGVVLEDRFETSAGPCAGWTPTLGTAIVLEAGGRTGNACRVCSTADGGNGVLTKTYATTEKASWTTLAYVRQDPMNPTIKGWGLATAFDYSVDGGGLDNSAFTSGALTNAYTLAQSSTPPVAPFSKIHIRFSTLGDAGQCFLVDDVQLFRTP